MLEEAQHTPFMTRDTSSPNSHATRRWYNTDRHYCCLAQGYANVGPREEVSFKFQCLGESVYL